MSVEQRLETVETDLELVKQLLASTASHGESAQRRLDQQTANQERLDSRLNEFIFQAQRLIGNQGERTNRLEGAYERLEAIAAHLTRKQDTHEQTMQALTQIAVDQATLLQRQDEQIAELRRIGTDHDSQLTELRQNLTEIRAAVERLDRLMDYVFRRDQPQ